MNLDYGGGAAPAWADLVVVGAGAKAAAIAVKVHTLNELGVGPLALTIIEAKEPAASWSGRNGMTTGEEPLAITPTKDVGFPYQSGEALGEVGDAVDRALARFSWQRYLMDKRGYARWVDAGSPTIQHREYGAYIAWVLARATAGVDLAIGRVTQVALGEDGSRWTIEVARPESRRRYECRALVLTGPGVHRPLPHDPRVASKIFHCDSRREEFACVPSDRRSEIAIVGGGESALSCAAFLRDFRPRAHLAIYTPTLPMSRGESFLENRVFSNPDNVAWSSLEERTRRDFFKHCDRGVFDPLTLSEIAYDERCRFVTGRVVHVGADGEGGMLVDHAAAGIVSRTPHDYLVNCTGFDLLEQLRGLFPPAVRAEIERRVGAVWDRPRGTELAFGRALELQGMHPRLHIPGLAALSQGPGFANLGCLGLLADRVVAPLVREESKQELLGAAIP